MPGWMPIGIVLLVLVGARAIWRRRHLQQRGRRQCANLRAHSLPGTLRCRYAVTQEHHTRPVGGHTAHDSPANRQAVDAAHTHTVFLTAFALVIFLLGVLIVFGLPTSAVGFRRLMGSFAPSISADYSPNRGTTIKPQRPLPTP